MRRFDLRFFSISFVSVLLMICGCGNDDDPTGPWYQDFSAEASFKETIEVASEVHFVLDGINGSVTLTGEAGGSSIEIHATRRVKSFSWEDAHAHLGHLDIVVRSGGRIVSVKTEQPDSASIRSYEVDYAITIPEGLTADIDNINGDVTLRSLPSGVILRLTNGKVLADDLDAGGTIHVLNGSIDASMSLLPEGFIKLSVAKGDIDLEVPRETSAEFKASALNGQIDLTNLILSDSSEDSFRLSGVLGDGNGTILLLALNGSIRVVGS